MKKANTIIRSGPFKGKRIEFAPTTGTDMFREVAENFMRRVFDRDKSFLGTRTSPPRWCTPRC
jgi:hypothetical protein